MAIPSIAWSFSRPHEFWRTPYRYFHFTIYKDFLGASLQVILPIGGIAIYCNAYVPGTGFVERGWGFALNWRKAEKLISGGQMFQRSWAIGKLA